jgi:hypothetical protein
VWWVGLTPVKTSLRPQWVWVPPPQAVHRQRLCDGGQVLPAEDGRAPPHQHGEGGEPGVVSILHALDFD